MNDDYSNGGVVSPDMASQMFGQQSVVDDVTDLSMFDNPTQNTPEPPSQFRSVQETDNAFMELVRNPAPAPERIADTRMNVSTAPNAPARKESFGDILSRITQSKPVNIAPAQAAPAPAPSIGTQPNVPAPETNEPKVNEPEWMKFFKPADEVPADKVVPQAENKQEPPVSSLPMNERLTKFFNPQEQEIINNAMLASTTALDNAQSVYNAAEARGYNPQEVLERINAIGPEEVVEMLEVYTRFRQNRATNPNPNPKPNPQFSRSFEQTRPVPGITLGNIQSTVKEPTMSPLGIPIRKLQI